MRAAILGNSGSGKSTLARWLASQSGVMLLDLDTVAWEPEKIAVARSPEAAQADVRAFCAGNKHWVLEGCYASLVSVALESSPLLLFMNPGVERCLLNCLDRPWEAHKYAAKEEQDERLPFLLSWVKDYYTREGDMSLAGHRACFEAYSGDKEELTTQPDLKTPLPKVLAWLTR